MIFCDAKLAIDLSQEGWLLKHAMDDPSRVVIGSRSLQGSHVVRCATRRWASRLYNVIAATVLPHLRGIRDSQCPFKCFSALTLDVLFCGEASPMFGRLTDPGLSFDTELLGSALLLRQPIVEIPIVSLWPRSEPWRAEEALHMLAGLLRQRRRLVPLQYRGSGKDACVYATRDGRAVWKILRRVHRARAQPSRLTRTVNRAVQPRSAVQALAKLLLRIPAGLTITQWAQRTPVVRRAFFGIRSLFGRAPAVNLSMIREASSRLPDSLVAPFTVHTHAWLVLPGVHRRRICHRVAIEQEAICESLEQRLEALRAANRFDTGRDLIEDALRIHPHLWEAGFFNADVNPLNDTGFDVHRRLVLTDIGNLLDSLDAALAILPRLRHSFGYHLTVRSLSRLCPEWADHFQASFASVFSRGHLIRCWSARR